MEHVECVIEFKNGERNWIDPVHPEDVHIKDGTLIVESCVGYIYEYSLKDIDKWCVRPYSEDTTYNPIED